MTALTGEQPPLFLVFLVLTVVGAVSMIAAGARAVLKNRTQASDSESTGPASTAEPEPVGSIGGPYVRRERSSMSTRGTAGKWRPYCSECKNVCETVVNDHGFDYEGPQGREVLNDTREESRCCDAEVLDENPTCSRCESYLHSDTEPVFWTYGTLLCEDCHNGAPLD